MSDGRGATPLRRGPAPARDGRTYGLRVVGFLDMLGAKASQRSERFLNDLGYTIASEKHHLALWAGRERVDFRTTWFSDNIGVSMPMPAEGPDRQVAFDTVAWYLGSLQAHLLAAHGIASRGGLSVGPCHHDDDLIFGTALVDAYTLESRTATVPRILLGAPCADLVDGSSVPIADGADQPGHHIDFLRVGRPAGPRSRADYLVAVRDAIVAGARAPVDGDAREAAKVFACWAWLATMFDRLVEEHPAPPPIGRPEPPPAQASRTESREDTGRSTS